MIHADPVRLLRGAVEIPSHSGGERAVAEYLAEQAFALDLRSTIDDAGNFVASTAGDPLRTDPATRDIVLLGHMDTVPGAIEVRQEGEALFGRGTVDAKGPLAAFLIVAAAAAPDLPAGTRLVVIGAVEEETPTSRGARAVISRYQPAACLIGEPSGWDGVTVGYKGRLIVQYESRRDCAHTAGPGASPADEFVDWWSRARAAALAMTDPAASPFERVQATIRRAETSTDGLEDRIEAVVGFRLPPGVTPAALRQACEVAAGPSDRLEFLGAEQPIVADRRSPLVLALTTAIRGHSARPRLVLKTGTSDMNVVGPAWNCPIAAYGPGDSSLDHTPREHILIPEYLRAIDVLRDALPRLAAGLAAGLPADAAAASSQQVSAVPAEPARAGGPARLI